MTLQEESKCMSLSLCELISSYHNLERERDKLLEFVTDLAKEAEFGNPEIISDRALDLLKELGYEE